jgi:hypothetical protein
MVKRGNYESAEIWKHNSLLGQTNMAASSMQHVIEAVTTTPQQKRNASKILATLFVLYNDLKENRIPPYSTSPRAVKRRRAIENLLD